MPVRSFFIHKDKARGYNQALTLLAESLRMEKSLIHSPPKNNRLSYAGLVRVLPGYLVGILGVVILFRSVLFQYPAKFLWADGFDSPLIYWIVNWGYYILFQARDPGNLWNANSFYPQPSTLAYSDSLLSIQLLYAPLRFIGLDSLYALYLALAMTALAACLLAQLALNRIGGFNFLEKGFIVFGAHFSLCVTSYFLHYQLFGFLLAPSFILFLFLFLRDFKTFDFFMVCLLYVVGAAYSTYLAPVLLIFALGLGAPILMLRIYQMGFRNLVRRLDWRLFLIAGVFAFFLYVSVIRPYLLIAHLFPKSSLLEYIPYAATPLSFFKGISLVSYWYPSKLVFYGYWESSYFPGYVLLSLGTIHMITTGFRLIHRRFPMPEPKEMRINLLRGVKELQPAQWFLAYILIFFVSTVVLSWGPYFKWTPDGDVVSRLPYYYLTKVIPGLDSLRAPGRFGMLVGFPLSILGVMAIRTVFVKKNISRIAVFFMLNALIIESIPNYQLYPFDPDPQNIYQWTAAQIPTGAAILDLPMVGEDHFSTIKLATRQLVGSTYHWGKIPNGYGAKFSPEHPLFLDADQEAQGEPGSLEPILLLARDYDFEYILVHLDAYSPTVQEKWWQLARDCGAGNPYQYQEAVLIHLRSNTCRSVR
jgi:hypothetical protein